MIMQGERWDVEGGLKRGSNGHDRQARRIKRVACIAHMCHGRYAFMRTLVPEKVETLFSSSATNLNKGDRQFGCKQSWRCTRDSGERSQSLLTQWFASDKSASDFRPQVDRKRVIL